ncbi:MAG: (Fe-S)-binding protein [Methanomassiliicoccales archaeon]|nr:MAG: (Fe-S)-binding protein [Methanomassiliicoccales archaeon]
MTMAVPNINDVYACLQCGYCRTVCPVYRETGWESLTPRGKVYWLKQLSSKGLLDRILRRKIEITDEWMQKMFTCTLCCRCESLCQVDIEFHEFWEEARKWLVENDYGPPQAAKDMYKNIENKEFKNPFMEPLSKRDEWYRDDYKLPSQAEVVFFPGCMTSFYEYQVLLSMMKVLTKTGVDFTTLGTDEMCCGAINAMTGQFDNFKQIAKHNVDQIEKRKASTVVTGCPGCLRALKKYKKYVGKLNFEVVHTTELIARLINEGKLEFSKEFKKKNLPLVYHDPCELGRISELEGRGIFDEPRTILNSVPGVDSILEYNNNRMDSVCCGGGGGLKAVDYDLTTKITARKVDEAIELGAKTIISSCPNCKAQISVGVEAKKEELKAKGEKFKMKVMDIADVVAKSL